MSSHILKNKLHKFCYELHKQSFTNSDCIVIYRKPVVTNSKIRVTVVATAM